MLHLVRLELKRLLKTPIFYISILGLFLVLFQETIPMFKHHNESTNVYVFTISIGWGLIRLVAPVLCTIPYSSLFCNELKEKYYYYTNIRVKQTDYLKSKFICGAVSAGSVMAIGFMIYSILISILFLRIDSSNPKHILDFGGTLWDNTYYIGGGVLFFMGQIVLAFIFGMVVGGVSMLVAIITADKYATIAIPFGLYYYMIFLAQRFHLKYLDLSYGIAPTTMQKQLYLDILIIQILIFCFCYIVFSKYGKRRLING